MTSFPTRRRPSPRPRPIPTVSPTPSPTPTPGPGTTFTLTTNIETVPASGILPPNSTGTGVIATASTYQTGDIINGNATSSLTVTVANTVASPLVEINNLGRVAFRTFAAQDVNAQLFTGVGTVASSGSNSNLRIDNGSISTTYELSTTVGGTSPNLSVDIRSSDLAGAADTIKFSAINAGGALNRSDLISLRSGVEAISVATSGTNFIGIQGSTTLATDARSVVLTGSGVNDVNIATGAIATTSNINGSALTGNLTLNVNGGLSTNDSVTGGSGTTDILRATTTAAATGVSVSGFETFALGSGSTGVTLFASSPNFSTIRVEEGATTSATLGVVGSPANIEFRGNGAVTAAALAAGATFGNLTINSSYTGSSDTVRIGVSNAGVTKNAGVNFTVGNLLANGIETANFVASDITGTGLSTFGTFGSNTLQNISYTSIGRVAAGVITGGTNTIASINYAGVTAADGGAGSVVAEGVSQNSLSSGATVVANATGTRFTLGTDQNAGVYTFVGGAGADSANFSALAGTSDNAVLQGAAGNDTLTSGAGADILQAGDGADILTGNSGFDTVTGGDGVDSFRYAQSLATDIDLITDFAFGATGDNVAYKAGTGALSIGTTGVSLVNASDNAVVGTSVTSVFTFAGGGATQAAGTNANFIQLTATSATNFSNAIGSAGVSVSTNIDGVESIAAVFYDSANQQAVFGFITNTSGTASGILNSSDTFTEIARSSSTLGAFQTLTSANAAFF